MMKIKYGTNPGNHYYSSVVLVLSWLLFAIFVYGEQVRTLLGECQQSIAHSRGLNVPNVPLVFYCEFSDEDCLCPIYLNASNTSGKCITDVQLFGSRILPLISCFLHIIVIRELFSLSGNHRHFIIYTLWVISLFTCIGTTIAVYWSTCSRAYIVFIQGITGGTLATLGLGNMLANIEHGNSRSNYNRITTNYPSQRISREKIFWKELI